MKFMLAIGGAASDAGAPDALNFVAHAFEDNSAVQDAMKNRGYGWLHRHLLTPSVTEYRQLLRESGKVLPGEEDLAKAVPDAYHILGHRPQRPHSRVTSDMMPAAPPAAPVLLPPMPAGGFLGPAERKLGIAAPSASDLAAGGAQAKDSMAAGGRAVEEAGRQAGNSIVEAARQAARIISDALAGAARGGGLASLHPVNADVGKSDVP
jgi:hypothetical protein